LSNCLTIGFVLFAELPRIYSRRRTKVKEKVEAVLNKIRPSLQADGGDVQLLEVSPEGIVKVKLTGACGHCPMSQMTLKMGIEKLLKQELPEIKEVVSA
jgi:Fe-S cluster biogenesis protein NfuA